MSYICEDCLVSWSASRWWVSHDCIGSSTPTPREFALYLGARQDSHGCWIPTEKVRPLGAAGYLGTNKYIRRLTGEIFVHRVSLRLKLKRPISIGLEASHECGPDHYENKACIRPSHLQESTHQSNHQYMHPKTRARISRAGGLNSPTRFPQGHVPWNKEVS